MHSTKRTSSAIALSLSLAASLLALSGCSASSAPSFEEQQGTSETAAQHQASSRPHDRFYASESQIDAWNIDDAYVIVDEETGVEYLYIWNSGGYSGGSAMTMLVNADGSPKINSAWALTHGVGSGDEANDDEGAE